MLAAGRHDRLSLAACDQLLARHLASAVARFGQRALGIIDLPPLADAGEIDAGHLRAAAVLYWASEVEQAGLPRFVERLAEGVVDGRLALNISPAAGDRLAEYWRDRHERFSADERAALYERLFGDATSFPRELDTLTETLAAIGDAGRFDSIDRLQARARVLGRQLAESLSQRSAGVTAFAARDVVEHVRRAAALLADPQLAAALGGAGGGIWRVVRVAAPLVLGARIDPDSHLMRAQAGRDLVGWLADHAGALVTGAVPIGAGDNVVQDAQAWRAAGGGG
jgi:hypothetical protein